VGQSVDWFAIQKAASAASKGGHHHIFKVRFKENDSHCTVALRAQRAVRFG